MRNPRYVVVVAMLSAGCSGTLLPTFEPARPGLPPRGPLVGTSTRTPEPHTGNEVAVAPPATVCELPEIEAREATTQNVSVTRTSDEELTRQLRVRLLSDPGLSSAARNVRITTRDGVVTLSGNISNVRERSQLQAHALALRGVARVDNLVHVAR